MSLYERLGASQGIKKIADDNVENHLNNPAIATRFKNMPYIMPSYCYIPAPCGILWRFPINLIFTHSETPDSPPEK